MPFLTSARSRFIGGSRVPPAPVPMAGAELLTNGDMEIDSGWLSNVYNTLNELSTEQFVSGAKSRKIQVTLSDQGTHQSVSVPAAWMLMRAKFYASAPQEFRIGNQNAVDYAFGSLTYIPASTWMELLFAGRYAAVNTVYLQSRLVDAPWYVDDASLKALTLSSLISTRPYASADCDISVAITRTAGTQAGFAVRVDDPANPQNFIIAYLDGAGNVKVDKCVAGTYTNVISGAVTYADGRILRIVCSGTSVSVYYHGTQVGTTQTVSDAGIVSNKNHGLFSTYAGNTFTGYVAA